MKLVAVTLVGWLLLGTPSAKAQEPQPQPRVVELKASDGTLLKATFFPAAKPGPGVLLFHQSNRTRTSWDDVARQLAAPGISALTIDERCYGESCRNIADSDLTGVPNGPN
jgi:alpha-beta hydrolase superfamily lysophospholipase